MELLRQAIRHMVEVEDKEEEVLSAFLSQTYLQRFRKQEMLSFPGQVPQEIYFVNQGIIRVIISDRAGTEHSIHFALEQQFIADYSSYIQQRPAFYSLQAVEDTEVVVLPRSAIEWGYKHLREGEKLGRLIAEFYFIYQDHRISNLYARTPKERYDSITEVFPHIHQRVPQHMIASYLGITPVHLSRLKKADNQGISAENGR